jgi:hypothetical protein
VDLRYATCTVTRSKDAVLYETASCLGTARPKDLRGRVPDPLFERPGQVRLIEISGLVDGVGDRFAPLQEGRRLLGALDLADAALGQPRGSQEAVTHRPGRHPLRSARQHGVNDRVAK